MALCTDFVSAKPAEGEEMKRRFEAFAGTLPKQTIAFFPKR
jgi:hypothetical protein